MLKGFRWGWVNLAEHEDARRRREEQTSILEVRDSSDYFSFYFSFKFVKENKFILYL